MNEKNIIVVARKGYSVLLVVGDQTFDIDCYSPVNLSNLFSSDVIARCASLEMHLQEGNLVYYTGQELPKNPNSARIDILRQSKKEHIQAQYTQTARDVTRTNMELETQTDVDDAMRKSIQEQVQVGKTKILQSDQKLDQQPAQSVNTSGALPERRDAMKPKELNLKVSMDVSPDKFAQKLGILQKRHEESVDADEIRAEQEILSQNNDEESI